MIEDLIDDRHTSAGGERETFPYLLFLFQVSDMQIAHYNKAIMVVQTLPLMLFIGLPVIIFRLSVIYTIRATPVVPGINRLQESQRKPRGQRHHQTKRRRRLGKTAQCWACANIIHKVSHTSLLGRECQHLTDKQRLELHGTRGQSEDVDNNTAAGRLLWEMVAEAKYYGAGRLKSDIIRTLGDESA